MFEASRGRIKVVGRAGVGIDNVDLGAATEVGGGAGRVRCTTTACHTMIAYPDPTPPLFPGSSLVKA